MKQQKSRENVVYRLVDMSAYGFLSHLPIITAACMITDGPIIELGAGFGSTFALHGICAKEKRFILTMESNVNWIGSFWIYNRNWHEIKYVTTFIDRPEYTEKDWGLAFVDHGILGQRGLALNSLSHVPIIVAHDTNEEALNYTNDGLPQVLDSFQYRKDFKYTSPQTSILSNSINVEEVFGGLQL